MATEVPGGARGLDVADRPPQGASAPTHHVPVGLGRGVDHRHLPLQPGDGPRQSSLLRLPPGSPREGDVPNGGVLADLPLRDRWLPDHREGGRLPRAGRRAARAPVSALGIHRARPDITGTQVGHPVRARLRAALRVRCRGRVPDVAGGSQFPAVGGWGFREPTPHGRQVHRFRDLHGPRVRARVRVPDPARLALRRRRPDERDDAEVPASGDPRPGDLRRRDHTESRPDLDARAVDPARTSSTRALSSSAAC